MWWSRQIVLILDSIANDLVLCHRNSIVLFVDHFSFKRRTKRTVTWKHTYALMTFRYVRMVLFAFSRPTFKFGKRFYILLDSLYDSCLYNYEKNGTGVFFVLCLVCIFFFLFFFLLILFVCFYSPWTLKTLFVPLFCFTEADLKWPVYISTYSVMQLFTFDFINWRFQFTVHMVILNCGTQFVFFIAIITERQPYLCVDWYFGSFFSFLTLQKRL